MRTQKSRPAEQSGNSEAPAKVPALSIAETLVLQSALADLRRAELAVAASLRVVAA